MNPCRFALFLSITGVSILVSSCKEAKQQNVEAKESTSKESIFYESLLSGLEDLPFPEAYELLMERIAAIPPEEIPEYVRTFSSRSGHPQSPIDSLAAEALLLRWSDLDPDATVDYLISYWDATVGSMDERIQRLFLIYRQSPQRLVSFIGRQPIDKTPEIAYLALSFLEPGAEGREDLVALTQESAEETGNYDERDRNTRINQIYQLAQSDPDAAIQAIEESMDDPELLRMSAHLLSDLAASRPLEAGQLAIKIAKNEPSRIYGLGAAVGPWMTIDPEAATVAIKGIANFDQRSEFFSGAYEAWALNQPELATQHALENIEASSLRASVMPQLIASWMQVSPREAATFLDSLPPHTLRKLSTAYEPWVEKDPLAAFSFIAESAREKPRMRSSGTTTFKRLMKSWMERNPDQALAWVREQPPDRIKDHLLTAALGNMPPEQLTQNLYLLDEIGHFSFREEIANQLVSSISEEDPVAGMQLIQQMPESIDSDALLETLFDTWSANDPVAAIENFPTDAKLSLQRKIAADIAERYYRADSEGALQWIGEQAPRVRTSAYDDIARHLRSRQGAPVAAEFLSIVPEGEASVWNYRYTASDWAETDPDSALNWTLGLHSGKARDLAIHSAVGKTLDQDPERVDSWLNSMNLPTEDRDELRVGTSISYAYSEPFVAALWILEIEQPHKRTYPMNRLRRATSGQDRAEIKSSITSDPSIPANEKQWLIDNL